MRHAIVLVLTAMAFTSSPAVAGNVYTAVASGNWNNPAIWTRVSGSDPVTYPMSADTAVVAGVTVIVSSDAAVATLQVSNGADLQITAGDTLTVASGTIDGTTSRIYVEGALCLDSGAFDVKGGSLVIGAGATLSMQGTKPRLDIHVPDGVRLAASTSVLAISANAAIGGSGSLQGGDSDAAIEIDIAGASSVELTLEPGAAIQGGLIIKRTGIGPGSARFNNQGQVRANAGRTILLDASLGSIADNGGTCQAPSWYVAAGAVMRFGKDASLTSAFRIDGTLVLDRVALSTSAEASGSGTVSLNLPASFCNSGPCP